MADPSVFTLAATLATLALITDVQQRRVPNWLIVVGLGLALGWHLLDRGPVGALAVLAGATVGFVLLLPFYIVAGLGAGDVKLLAALGAIVGPQHIVSVAVYGAVLGGVIALFVLARRGVLAHVLHRLLAQRALPTTPSRVTAPYAVAIAGGVYLAIVLPPVWR